MKRLIMTAMLLLGIAQVVVLGQGMARNLTITSQIRVYPADTTNVQNFSYVQNFVRSGKFILGATTNNNIIRSSDNGKTWQELGLRFDFGLALSMSITDSGTVLVYGPTSADPIWRSTDGGNTWTAVTTGAGRYFVNASDGSIISGGQNSIYRSTDDGRTWVEVADSSLLHMNSAMSLFTTSKGTILMGVMGASPDFYGIYRSTDDGLTWTFVNSGLPGGGNEEGYVDNFAETSDGTIFAMTDYAGIYESTDEGETWQKVSTGLPFPDSNPTSPTILASSELGLLIGNGNNVMGGGIIRSTDEGITWSILGFDSCQIGAMMQLDTNEVLANINGSIYILTLDFVTAVNEPTYHPTTFALSQNYPNPFNPTTTIQFSVQKRTSVNLTIFNVLGQKVQTLVDEEKAPGTYSVQFNGSNLSSGIYFYRLQAGTFSKTEKMELLK